MFISTIISVIIFFVIGFINLGMIIFDVDPDSVAAKIAQISLLLSGFILLVFVILNFV